jgi:hypothetical protein
MVLFSIALGIILTLLGVLGYALSGGESVTALIPSFFGIPVLILGLLARKEHLRKHMMHAITLLALIGFAGSARGLSTFVDMLSGSEVARPLATAMQSIMALLTLAFVIFAVKSFIDARRQRDASAAAGK